MRGPGCIHVVDLDGAVAGESRNLLSIDAILKQGNIPIEVGGGIRTMEHVPGCWTGGSTR